MPKVQLDALVDLHRWLFDVVIKEDPILGTNLISHSQISKAKDGDPGDWLMHAISDALQETPHLVPDQSESPPDLINDRLANLESLVGDVDSKIDSLIKNLRSL